MIFDERIRLHFQKDDGSCWATCEICGGRTKVPVEGARDQSSVKVCTGCTDGRVERRERIHLAVRDWHAEGPPALVSAAEQSTSIVVGFCLHVWDNRKGQPWEPPLTEFVTAYREPAPCYATAMTDIVVPCGKCDGHEKIIQHEYAPDDPVPCGEERVPCLKCNGSGTVKHGQRLLLGQLLMNAGWEWKGDFYQKRGYAFRMFVPNDAGGVTVAPGVSSDDPDSEDYCDNHFHATAATEGDALRDAVLVVLEET